MTATATTLPQVGEQWRRTEGGRVYEVACVSSCIDTFDTLVTVRPVEGYQEYWTMTLKRFQSRLWDGRERFVRVYPLPLYSTAWD